MILSRHIVEYGGIFCPYIAFGCSPMCCSSADGTVRLVPKMCRSIGMAAI